MYRAPVQTPIDRKSSLTPVKTETAQPLAPRGRALLDEAEVLCRAFHEAATGKGKARALLALEAWNERLTDADWEAMAAADGEPGRR